MSTQLLALPEKQTKKERKTVYLSKPIADWLDNCARERRLTMSDLFEYLLKDAINRTGQPLPPVS